MSLREDLLSRLSLSSSTSDSSLFLKQFSPEREWLNSKFNTEMNKNNNKQQQNFNKIRQPTTILKETIFENEYIKNCNIIN